MKEDYTKKLIKQSLQQPSDDFTDLLMQQVEQEKPVRFLFWHMIALVGSLVIILGFLFLVNSQTSINIPSVAIRFSLPSYALHLVAILFITLSVNQFLVLRRTMV